MLALVLVMIRSASVFGYADSDSTAFGSKTAYDWVRNETDFKDLWIKFEDHSCKAIHVNMVARHGYRLPEASEMVDIRGLLDKVKGHEGDAGSLEVNIPKEDEGQLNRLGKKEMGDLGTRTFDRFKDLLKDRTPGEMEFISTSMRRVLDSANQFKMAIMKRNNESNPSPTKPHYPTHINDTLLRSCPRYKAAIDETSRQIPSQLADLYELSSANLREVLSHVTGKLDLKPGATLTLDDVKRVWQLCALERVQQQGAQGAEGTSWCDLMENQHREYMELQEDLDSYRRYSYGNDVTKAIHCVVLQKLLRAMDDAKRSYLDSKTYSVGTFMFGHTGTLLGTLTALGLFPTISASQDREFRIDKIAPMSGNVGFGLYFCPNRPTRVVSGSSTSGEKESESNVSFVVKLFSNERETNKPNRTEKAVYEYEVFKEMFKYIEHCNAQEVCKLSTETRVSCGNENDTSGGYRRSNSVLTILMFLFIASMI